MKALKVRFLEGFYQTNRWSLVAWAFVGGIVFGVVVSMLFNVKTFLFLAALITFGLIWWRR